MEEECVMCTRVARGEYLGYPCCMGYECMKEMAEIDDLSEAMARETFGKWLKRMMRISSNGFRKKKKEI